MSACSSSRLGNSCGKASASSHHIKCRWTANRDTGADSGRTGRSIDDAISLFLRWSTYSFLVFNIICCAVISLEYYNVILIMPNQLDYKTHLSNL